MSRLFVPKVLICLLAAASFASANAARAHSDWPKGLEEVAEAVAKYKDPIQAVHDGYLSTLACVLMPGGGMGIHFVNGRLIGPEPDPMKPAILMYEPAGGKLRLIAVEWLVPYAEGMAGRPELFGRKFHGPMEGHEPILPKEVAHFDLHAWIYKENPKGLWAGANPDVTCEGAVSYTVHEGHAQMIPR